MAAIEDIIIRLTTERGAGKSICPSEVAREMGDPWQRHMTPVRQAAIKLATEGRIDILRKGKPVADPNDVKGVIRPADQAVIPPPGGTNAMDKRFLVLFFKI